MNTYDSEVALRDLDMEYRLLIRMNCHKMHYTSLFKSQNLDFKQKNRYNEVLPFQHSMVKLNDIPEIAERYASYINANYINVSYSSIL
jgi:protein tyrosine phosphatase